MDSLILRIYDPRGQKRGFLLELTAQQSLADLHWAITSALRQPGEGDFLFTAASPEKDPAAGLSLFSRSTASLFHMDLFFDETGDELFHRDGGEDGPVARVVMERRRRAFRGAVYPRRAWGLNKPKGPAPVGNQDEESLDLEKEMLLHCIDLERMYWGGQEAGDPKKWNEAQIKKVVQPVESFLNWVGKEPLRWLAVEMKSEEPWPYWLAQLLTVAWPAAGYEKKALDLITRLAEASPRKDWVARRAIVLGRLKRNEEALSLAEKVLEESGENWWNRFLAGQAFETAGAPERAVAIYRELEGSELPPSSFRCEVLERLVPLLKRLNRSAEAGPLAQQLAFLKTKMDAEEEEEEEEFGDEEWGDEEESPSDPFSLPTGRGSSFSKVGRNDPCPCGSGKKFKKCHGDEAPLPLDPESRAASEIRLAVLRFAAEEEFANDITDALEELGFYDIGIRCLDDVFRTQPGSRLSMVLDWILFDFRSEEGCSFAELFEKRHGRDLPSIQQLMLQRMKATFHAPYQIVALRPEEGMTLAELPTGDRIEVTERRATREVRRWDLLVARTIEADGATRLLDSMLVLHAEEKSGLLGRLITAAGDFRELFPKATWADFFKANCRLVFDFVDEMARRPLPQLVTTDGEPLMSAKAHFQLVDRKAVTSALKGLPELEEQMPGTSWAWLRGEKKGERLQLGRVEVEKGRLVLECLSRERLETGKAMLTNACGKALKHIADDFQDPISLIASRAEAEEREENQRGTGMEGAEEEERIRAIEEVQKKRLEQHYAAWPDMPLPALEGKTPRQALASPVGRYLVSELLRSFENREDHMKEATETRYDFSRLWDALGLDPETEINALPEFQLILKKTDPSGFIS